MRCKQPAAGGGRPAAAASRAPCRQLCRPLGGAAAAVSTKDLLAGDVTHLPVDVPNIHCMHNATGEPAYSIHVYGGDADQIGPNVKNIYNSES